MYSTNHFNHYRCFGSVDAQGRQGNHPAAPRAPGVRWVASHGRFAQEPVSVSLDAMPGQPLEHAGPADTPDREPILSYVDPPTPDGAWATTDDTVSSIGDSSTPGAASPGPGGLLDPHAPCPRRCSRCIAIRRRRKARWARVYAELRLESTTNGWWNRAREAPGRQAPRRPRCWRRCRGRRSSPKA